MVMDGNRGYVLILNDPHPSKLNGLWSHLADLEKIWSNTLWMPHRHCPGARHKPTDLVNSYRLWFNSLVTLGLHGHNCEKECRYAGESWDSWVLHAECIWFFFQITIERWSASFMWICNTTQAANLYYMLTNDCHEHVCNNNILYTI